MMFSFHAPGTHTIHRKCLLRQDSVMVKSVGLQSQIALPEFHGILKKISGNLAEKGELDGT